MIKKQDRQASRPAYLRFRIDLEKYGSYTVIYAIFFTIFKMLKIYKKHKKYSV